MSTHWSRRLVTTPSRLALAIGLAVALSGLLAGGALAAPITYTSCPSFSQFQADVQAVTGTETITFGPGAADCVLTTTSGVLVSATSLTIDGNGLVLAGSGSPGEALIGFASHSNISLTLDHTTLQDSEYGILALGWDSTGGTVTLTNSTVTGNTFGIQANQVGGGVDLNVTLIDSTVSGNSVDGVSGVDNATVTDSTVSGNGVGVAGGNAGGIFASYATLTDSTVSGNGTGVVAAFGATLTATILVGNGTNCNYGGSRTDLGYNLSTDGSCGFSGIGSQNNVATGSLALGPLANNGGPTQTQDLGPGSIAIDAIPLNAGQCAVGATTDQRGVARPQGPGCDVGAYEQLAPTVTVTPSPVTVATGAAGAPLSATVATTGCPVAVPNQCPTVDEGSVIFTVTDASKTVVGTATANVSGGSAAVGVPLPGTLAPGSYTVTATYSDASNATDPLGGATGTGTLVVNAPPTAGAGGPYTGLANAPVTIAGAASDPDGDAVSTQWTYAADAGTTGTCTFGDAATLRTSVICTSVGSYTLTLSASDGINAPVTSTARLTITPPLTVNAGGGTSGYSGAEGAAIALGGTVTSGGGGAVTSQWTESANAGTDGTCTFADASSPTTTVSCTDDGSYTLTLSASDGINAAVTSSAQLTVGNAPIAVNAITGLPGTGVIVNGSVSVGASFTDPGGADGHTATINWGDGSTTTGVVTETVGTGTGSVAGSHTYSAVGSYTVTVAVSDGDSPAGTGSSTAPVIVTYGICPVSGQEHEDQGGGTIPVKLRLCDANGSNLSGPGVTLTAVGVVDSHGTTYPVQTDGHANAGGVFRYGPDRAGYILNLKTRGLPPGSYTLAVTATGDPVTHGVAFVVERSDDGRGRN